MSKTENIKSIILKKLMSVAGWMQKNIYISAISEGMMSTSSILIGGGIVNMLINLPITPWSNFLTNTGIMPVLAAVVMICQLPGIFITFALGRVLGQKKGMKDGYSTGLISLVCFLIITPFFETEKGGTAFLLDMLGAQAVITAMLVGVFATSFYTFLYKKDIRIKFPDSVPPYVGDNLSCIPTSLLTMIPFMVLRGIFIHTSWGSFTAFINGVLQIPLTTVGNSLAGHLILLFICCLLWWCGMHGTNVIYPAAYLLMAAPMTANITAAAAGLPAPNMLSLITLWIPLQVMGGPGCLFGLYIALVLLAKSNRYKTQGRLMLIPGLFNIIEPAVYGLPIVLNPLLLVPFICTPLVMYVSMYICMNIGLFTTPVVFPQSFLPAFINGFLCGGGIGFSIFIIVWCILSTLIYMPFVKVIDNVALKEEAISEVA